MANINVDDVLSKLSDKEKVSLLAGTDFWHTAAVPSQNVPALRLSDGPNGVRGTRFFNSVPSACFPCGTALGATWDTNLLEAAGELMGEEAIAKGAHVLLGPCINMQRSPLGGRGFESISEDPVLAGLGAAALVRGIQKKGIAATIKHFVCNDQEHERMAYDALVSERAFREIYALPFQIAVRDSSPRCFMTAYNKLNGTHLSENTKIIQDMLRDEWKWEGLVMSDWFGTYSSDLAVNAGLSLEMPGPSVWRGKNLQHAITSGKVSRYTLDKRVKEVLDLVNWCAGSGVKENAHEGGRDTPETSAFLRKIAADAIVLMKNEKSLLPLKKDKKTLLVGPSGHVSTFCGGGSSAMTPYYAITPFDGIQKKLSTDLSFTVGCHSHKELPLLGSLLQTKDGKPGVVFKVYNDAETVPNREIVESLELTNTMMMLLDYKHPKLNTDLWYATIDGYLVAEEDGELVIGLSVYGTANLYVDGKLLIDNTTTQTHGTTFFGAGTIEEEGILQLTKGTKYHIHVDYAGSKTSKLAVEGVVTFGGGGIRLGGVMTIDPEKEVARAAEMAKEADQVIVCVGLNQDWEGEGVDRANMDLPGHMNALISAVAAANPNTAVVMQSGTPVEMPWIKEVNALVHAWYGGNETGNAIADVLFGDVNPGGKLSLSFPKRVQDNPAYLNYTSQRGRTLYGEDVYIGYRFYEATEKDVLFPFGHGLSYTTFSFSDLAVKADAEELTVSLKVTNTGSIAGAEVVQVYVSQENPSIPRPPKELKGFKKVFLQPGASEVVEVKVQLKYAASFWDEGRDGWIMEKGAYGVIVGDSSASTEGKTVKGTFDVAQTKWWNGV